MNHRYEDHSPDSDESYRDRERHYRTHDDTGSQRREMPRDQGFGSEHDDPAGWSSSRSASGSARYSEGQGGRDDRGYRTNYDPGGASRSQSVRRAGGYGGAGSYRPGGGNREFQPGDSSRDQDSSHRSGYAYRSRGRGYDSDYQGSSPPRNEGQAQMHREHQHTGDDFGRHDFRPEESLPYYGTGNYSSGGSGLAGGLRGMQGMGAYGPSGGSYNAEYNNPAEGAYGYSRGDQSTGRGESEHHRKPGLLERFFGRGPKGYKRSDERVREDISERLMHSPYIDSSDVTIDVAEGVVTLQGTVPERRMKHLIEDLADSCMGVKDVDNKVRVKRNTSESSNENASVTGTSSAGAAPGVQTTAGTATKSRNN